MCRMGFGKFLNLDPDAFFFELIVLWLRGCCDEILLNEIGLVGFSCSGTALTRW